MLNRNASIVSSILAVYASASCVLPEVFEAPAAPLAEQPASMNTGSAAVAQAPSGQAGSGTAVPVNPAPPPLDAGPAVAVTSDPNANIAAAGSNAAGATATAPAVSAPSGDACREDEARCTVDNSSREQCVNGSWMEVPCGTGTVCSADKSDPPGTCRLEAAACAGHGGTYICDERGNLMACNAQEVIASTKSCLVARLCNAKAARCETDPCQERSRRCRFLNGHWEVLLCAVRAGSRTTDWQASMTCGQDQTCEMSGSGAWCSTN